MKKIAQNPGILRVWRIAKPWIIVTGIFLILRFTGSLSYLTNATSGLLMATGAMDANADDSDATSEKDFDYNFKLKDMSGHVVDMNDFKGKAIFLNLWATWCGPCRMEMPAIQNLYNQVDHNKIAFVMLSLDGTTQDEKVTQYLKKEKFTFPIYRPIDELPSQIRVPSIPTTFIISPQGKIVSKNVGAANYDNDGFKKFLIEVSERK